MKRDLWTAYLILNYLAKRPSAKDTLEGIAEWWIVKERISFAVERISVALQFWVSKGYITVRYVDGQKSYELNQEKLPEIQAALDQLNGNIESDPIRNQDKND